MDASQQHSSSPGTCASRDFPCSHLSLSQTGLLTRFSKQQRISTLHTTSVPEYPDPTETPFWGDQQTQEALEGGLEGEELGRLSMGEGHTQPQPHGGWWFSTKAAMHISASPLMTRGQPTATGHFTGPGPHLPGFMVTLLHWVKPLQGEVE